MAVMCFKILVVYEMDAKSGRPICYRAEDELASKLMRCSVERSTQHELSSCFVFVTRFACVLFNNARLYCNAGASPGLKKCGGQTLPSLPWGSGGSDPRKICEV